MTQPDPTAVREAENRMQTKWIKTSALCNGDGSLRLDYLSDAATLVDAYLSLTDPTPLTVEVMVGMGFVECFKDGDFLGCDYIDRDGETLLRVWPDTDNQFHWYGALPPYAPRTAGELAQLLMRIEK